MICLFATDLHRTVTVYITSFSAVIMLYLSFGYPEQNQNDFLNS